MTELSPAAQQVFWAFNEAASGKPDDWHYLPAIAAALEAAADQVVPAEEAMPLNLAHRVRWDAMQSVCYQLLAIAAELKAQ
jgi:hypothetical protein